MPRKNEFSAALTVLEFDCEPEELTYLVGVQPSKSWKKGDLINPFKDPSIKTSIKIERRHEFNGWSVSSKIDSSFELSKHIESVFNQLQDNWTNLVTVCSHYYVELQCVVYIREENNVPAIFFEKDVIHKLSELSGEIDVDMYVLS